MSLLFYSMLITGTNSWVTLWYFGAVSTVWHLGCTLEALHETICRSYLWTGKNEISKNLLVSWEKMCLPQGAGGLNVINLCLWNKAVIAKHIWEVAMKKTVCGSMASHFLYKEIGIGTNPSTQECLLGN